MHIKNKFLLLSVCCAAAVTLVAEYSIAEEEQPAEYKIYNVQTETICKKQDGKTYCTDKEGKAITGEMLKYKNGIIVRRYPMKKGYLDGIGKVYYDSGRLKKTLEYKDGVLNGSMVSYERNGNVTESIPYVDGKKEGVALYKMQDNILKMIYINDEMNGDYQIWNKDNTKKIYDLKMAQNVVLSGIYYHYEKDDTKCNKEKIVSEEIPELVIKAVNENCLIWQPELTCSACPAIAIGSNPACNQEWRQEHRKEMLQYFISCRCPRLTDGSLEANTPEYIKYKKECINEKN